MYYGMSDSKNKWILMKGWLGCQPGQGNVIFSDLEDWQLDRIYETLEKRNPPNKPIHQTLKGAGY